MKKMLIKLIFLKKIKKYKYVQRKKFLNNKYLKIP